MLVWLTNRVNSGMDEEHMNKTSNLIHFNIIYNDWLGLRTRTILFDPRTKATGSGQQIRARVKQNCCRPRNQSISVLLYTLIFPNFLIHSFHALTYPLDIFYILVRQVRESGRRLDIVTSIYQVTYWTNENKAIGQHFVCGL